MAVATSFFSMTIADNTLKSNGNPETTSAEVALTALNAGNLAAQATLIAALRTAVEGIILGNVVGQQTVQNRPVLANTPAASNLAQRENKWLVRYHGAITFQKFRVSYGTADLSLLPDHSEFLDLTTSPGDAFKDAFEAVVKNPNDQSEAVVVDTVQFVGRNT